MTPFIWTQKQKQLLIEVTFESVYTEIVSNIKKYLGKGSAGLYSGCNINIS